MDLHEWIDKRQREILPYNLYTDQVMKRIYTKLEPCNYWNDVCPTPEYGAIFNLEFSPHGNIVAAACERKAVVLFDAISQQQTQRILKAHSDSVNCIKFLDNKTFATCSDDTTVCIWDIRSLKQRMRMLQGHSNWVKNVEYSVKDKLLVTSGFDGSIFTWDINSHTEEGLVYQKVFSTSGLMRCRISPDGTKLVLCTTGGYLMIIHKLDLTTLHKDLCGFRPTLYRLMQMANQYIPNAGKFDHIFSRNQKRNRVELVTDFPKDNDAEIIHALQIHPQGHSVLSRNVSIDEKNEYTCIHDLNEELYDRTINKRQKRKQSDIESASTSTSTCKRTAKTTSNQESPDSNQPSTSNGYYRPLGRILRFRRRHRPAVRLSADNAASPPPARSSVPAPIASDAPVSRAGAVEIIFRPPNRATNNATEASNAASTSRNTSSNFVPDIWAAEISVAERAARLARHDTANTVAGYDFVYAISSGIMQNTTASTTTTPAVSASASASSADASSTETRPVSPPVASSGATLYLNDNPIPYCKEFILQNARKLMYYAQESNEGRGFIKESCFSADGRIICSPYKTGVRLLSYTENCAEHPGLYAHAEIKSNPKELIEVKTIDCHSDTVLSSAFSPKQPLLVTGCKTGKVTWHYPYL